MIQRTCRMCGKEFWAKAHNTLYCEGCGKERIRQSRAKSERRYYQEHRDELLAKSRQKYRDDPSQRKEINRKYYEEHAEEIKKKYRLKANTPEIKGKRQVTDKKAYQAEYYRKNRDRIVAQRKAKREMDKKKESTD